MAAEGNQQRSQIAALPGAAFTSPRLGGKWRRIFYFSQIVFGMRATRDRKEIVLKTPH